MNEELMKQLMAELMQTVMSEIQGRVAIDEYGTIYIEFCTSTGNLIALEVHAEEDCYHVNLTGGFKDDDRFEINESLVVHDVTEACVELGTLVCAYFDEDIEFIKAAIRDKWIEPGDARDFVLARQIAHSAEEDIL